MNNTYDNAVDMAKAAINEAIRKAYLDMQDLDIDAMQAIADAQEEVFVDYLEANGFEVIDLDEE